MNTTNTPTPVSVKPLNAGHVTIYETGDLRLHAYATEDALSDEVFIVESQNALVGIELPPFTSHLNSWKSYIEALGKPMKDLFLSNHPAGASYTTGMTIWGTQRAQASIESGPVHATTQKLHTAFGDDFHGGNDTLRITRIVPAGPLTVAGIDFQIIEHADTYDLTILGLNAIYTHMLGKYTHSILTGMDQIQEMQQFLESYQQAGYALILSSHAEPEGQDAVTEKRTYLTQIQQLAETCPTADDFMAAVRKAFPNYGAENYLQMTAKSLYGLA